VIGSAQGGQTQSIAHPPAAGVNFFDDGVHHAAPPPPRQPGQGITAGALEKVGEGEEVFILNSAEKTVNLRRDPHLTYERGR